MKKEEDAPARVPGSEIHLHGTTGPGNNQHPSTQPGGQGHGFVHAPAVHDQDLMRDVVRLNAPQCPGQELRLIQRWNDDRNHGWQPVQNAF